MKTIYNKSMFEKERASSRNLNHNLQHLEDRVFAWGTRKHKLDKVFAKNHGSYMDRFESFPESYQGMMLASWLFSRVILNPSFLTSFARKEKESLLPDHNEYLKLWKKTSPIWSLFLIAEQKDDDIFEIEDQLTGDRMLLHSQSIAGLEKDKPFISILLPLDGIWVSYGIIHKYKGSEAYHILNLIRFMDERLYEAKDFTDFIHKYYARFFQIDKVMESPPVVNNNDLIEPNWLETTLSGFDPKRVKADCDIKKSGNIVYLKPKNEKPFPFNKIYFNSETEEAFFSSMTLEGYRELCQILPDYDLPELPDFCFSMSLYTVMKKDMDLPVPGDYWESFFSKEENTTPEKQEMMDTINTLLREATEAENHGKKINLYKRGTELGLDNETIRSIEETLEQIRTKWSE